MICTLNDCQNKKYGNLDICRKHHHETYSNEKCEVCDSKLYVFHNKETGKMLCNRHAQQIRRRGKILTRTLFSPNEFIFHDESVEIVLFDLYGNVSGSTYIDIEDYDKCKEHKWRLHSMGYAATGDKSEILLHRYIVKSNQGEQIDHIDRDKLNNKKSNFRVATQDLNMINASMQSNNTSGVIGVSWNKEKNGWDVQLKKQEFKLNKRFKSFDKAVTSRLVAESIYFKSYSPNHNRDTNTIQFEYLSRDDGKQTYVEVDMDGEILHFKKLA